MKMRKKSDLPQKTCAACGLPFTWRRKWARDWEQVKYCSDRCRSVGSPPPNHNNHLVLAQASHAADPTHRLGLRR